MAVTRDQIWYNLANAKFKEFYTHECSRVASKWSNTISFVLAFASTASVARWAIWKDIPYVWATIVATAQVLQIMKPSVPFIRYDKNFLDASFKFQFLYLKYERLWQKIDGVSSIPKSDEKLFNELRIEEAKIEYAHRNEGRSRLSEKKTEKINSEVNKFLDQQFKRR